MPTDDWRADLEAASRAVWDLLVAHPGLSVASVGATDPGPTAVRRVGELTAHLIELGFAPDAALLAVDTVIDLPVDVAIRAPSHGHEPGLDEPAAEWFERKLDLVLAGIAVRLAPTEG
ncbi:MAG: hypothetical protein AAF945_21400 [Actinomycetota bacterium]